MGMGWIQILNWGGSISCTLGALLVWIASVTGKEARQLQGARQVNGLSGELCI
jgi:hypothetical protein